MKHQKLFLITVCLVSALAILAGCAQSTPVPTTPAKTTTSAPATTVAPSTTASPKPPTAAPPASPKTILLRYAGSLTLDHVITKQMTKWVEMVQERTKGQVKIEVYPNGQLYKDNEMARVLSSGMVDLGQNTTATLGGIAPTTELLETFLIFKSWDHTKATIDASWEIMDNELKSKNMKLVSWMPYGEDSGFIIRKKVLKVDDMRGLTIRSFGEANSRAIDALGAKPTYTAAGEVYQAIQSGVLDGACSGWSSYYSRRWYEVAKYLLDFPFIYAMFSTEASLDSWNKLPKDVQDIMIQTGKDIYAWGLEQALKDDEAAKVQLKEKGLDIYRLDDKEAEAWRQKLYPLWNAYAAKNADCAKILNIAKQLAAKY